jgi:hypothetical protein
VAGLLNPTLRSSQQAPVSAYLTDTVSMSRGLHEFQVGSIVFLFRRIEVIHLPSFEAEKHPVG